jgi:hypothetical protein
VRIARKLTVEKSGERSGGRFLGAALNLHYRPGAVGRTTPWPSQHLVKCVLSSIALARIDLFRYRLAGN